MKHTEEYLQAKYVVENPKEYDNRDVQRANSFMRAYEQALNICSVSQQRELLKAFLQYVNCSDTDSKVSFDLLDKYLNSL